MTNEQAIKQLWLTYKKYYTVSKAKGVQYDSSELASAAVDGYLDYIKTTAENKVYERWGQNLVCVVANQVRIVDGLCEIYDKPIVREKNTEKTRWSL
jgi:hypothetical protein